MNNNSNINNLSSNNEVSGPSGTGVSSPDRSRRKLGWVLFDILRSQSALYLGTLGPKYLDFQKCQNNGPISQKKECRQYRVHYSVHVGGPGRNLI